MKEEKKKDYRKQRPDDVDSSDHFRRQWIINHFSAWNGRKSDVEVASFDETPLSSFVDEEGASSKSADLPIHSMTGRFVTREVIVGLRKYVQWKEAGTPNFDRVDIQIDIPTTDLDIVVAVDQDIYSLNDEEKEEIPNLSLEFRNREAARCEGKDLGLYPENMIIEQYGRSPDDEGLEDAIGSLRALQTRLKSLTTATTREGRTVAETVDRQALATALTIPDRILFYRLTWPSPHLGIAVCIRWEKPLQHQEPSP